MTELEKIGQAARQAARKLAKLGTADKNRALLAIAEGLLRDEADILSANADDVARAVETGMTRSLLDRLSLSPARMQDIVRGVRDVAALPDPVGRVTEGRTLESGIRLTRVTVPIGVIAVICEARPNVTSDAAALLLKSGNACIIRGGKEAVATNAAIARSMRRSLANEGIDENTVCVLADTSRETATALMRLNEYVDCLIPRGGAGLIRSVVENATVPVIETGVGNCHAYVESTADLAMARDIVFNAKTSRPSVCNALETLLVDESIAAEALPVIYGRLAEKSVEIRGCEKTCAILPGAVPATEWDYENEFLDQILAVKVVANIDEAIAHIERYSTGHSECIITRSLAAAEQFTREVDSAAVYVNASTRFTDGGEFGLGAEIGISTQKLHARGPMGLEQIVSYKYVAYGDGQVR